MNKKVIIYIVIGLVVVGIGAGIYWGFYGNNLAKNNQNSNKTPSGTNVKPLSQDAASKFFVGKQLSFDDSCKSIPDKLTVKNNTAVMLSNEGEKDIIVSLDQKNITIATEQYKLTTVSSKTLPHTIVVGCGANKTAASIIVQ